MEPNYWQLYDGLAVVNLRCGAGWRAALSGPGQGAGARGHGRDRRPGEQQLPDEPHAARPGGAGAERGGGPDARERAACRWSARGCASSRCSSEERLCYEFTGTFEQVGRYLVYIDANTGERIGDFEADRRAKRKIDGLKPCQIRLKNGRGVGSRLQTGARMVIMSV